VRVCYKPILIKSIALAEGYFAPTQAAEARTNTAGKLPRQVHRPLAADCKRFAKEKHGAG
jgi:hypothetical protein